MLKISKKTELGLLLLTDLARAEKGVVIGLREWAGKRKLPYRFLSKVAVDLKKAGFLKSKEGREGGYWLAKEAGKIKIKDVLEALEGSIAPVKCLQGEICGAESFCCQKDLMKKLTMVIEKQLKKTNLGDLVKD